MGDEVVADPEALEEHARTVRARLLAIDVGPYRDALLRFSHADPNDVGDGDMADLGPGITRVLEEVERGNRAAEQFAVDLRVLDETGSEGTPTSVAIVPTSLAAVQRRVMALPGAHLLAGAHARAVVDDLRTDLATAGDPAAARERAAADRRLAGHLAALLDAGIEADPDLQGTVVGRLGPGWLADFAALAARRDLDAGTTVPWTRAAMEVVAGWTATWVRRQSPDHRAAFVAALPDRLVPVLATLADWGPEAGAEAAMHGWDAPEVAPLAPVAPRTWARAPHPAAALPGGWPPASTTREAVATMLAAHPATAHRVLTGRDDILAGLVTSSDHPAAAAAVIGGLVRHPTRQLAASGQADGLRASAAAVARLVASVAGLGARTLTPGGRAALAATTRFHLGMVTAGRRDSLAPFLHDATGTHAWLVDEVLGAGAAAAPGALRRIVPRLTGPELAALVGALARTDGKADAALVEVGREFATLLADRDASGQRDAVEAAGPQTVALLTAAAVDARDTDLLAGLGRGVVAALSDMPWDRQRDWLGMLAAADDGAGWASVLLACSDGLPPAMLPVMLSMERPMAMRPRSRAVRQVLDHRTGDWTSWSADLYDRMFAGHPAPLSVVLGMAGGALPHGSAPTDDDRDVRSAASRLASGAVSPGLARGIGALVAARPGEVTALLEAVDRGDGAAYAGIAALVELTQADGGPGPLVDAVGSHLLAGAFASSAVPLATGRADPEELDLVHARFHRAGELIGQLDAFTRPRGLAVDTPGILRVVVVRLVDEVPVVGTIAGAADDAMTLAGAVDSLVPDLDAMARQERASILAAMDLLSSAATTRRDLLEDFGFVLDDVGTVIAVPNAATTDPNTVLATHPEYLPFFVAAEALADGLEAGQGLLD